MATSSIMKEFYIDKQSFDKLKKETQSSHTRKIVKSPSLEKGRKKLATFVFR